MNVYTRFTDLELIQLLRNGNEAAFSEIYKRYAGKLAGFAASKLYNIEDARDVIHDMFVKLWEDRANLIITTSLQAYLFTIIRYRIIDKIRSNITRQEYAAMLQSLQPVAQVSVELRMEAKETNLLVTRLLDQLSPKVKEIYILKKVDGLSVRQISQKLQISEQTVKNQLTTALKHLRKSMVNLLLPIIGFWWLR